MTTIRLVELESKNRKDFSPPSSIHLPLPSSSPSPLLPLRGQRCDLFSGFFSGFIVFLVFNVVYHFTSISVIFTLLKNRLLIDPPTHRRADRKSKGGTDGRTDTPSRRDARTCLKMSKKKAECADSRTRPLVEMRGRGMRDYARYRRAETNAC